MRITGWSPSDGGPVDHCLPGGPLLVCCRHHWQFNTWNRLAVRRTVRIHRSTESHTPGTAPTRHLYLLWAITLTTFGIWLEQLHLTRHTGLLGIPLRFVYHARKPNRQTSRGHSLPFSHPSRDRQIKDWQANFLSVGQTTREQTWRPGWGGGGISRQLCEYFLLLL